MSGPESFVAFCTPIQLKNNLVEKLRENFRLSLPNNIPMDLPPHLKKVLPSPWPLAGRAEAEFNLSFSSRSTEGVKCILRLIILFLLVKIIIESNKYVSWNAMSSDAFAIITPDTCKKIFIKAEQGCALFRRRWPHQLTGPPPLFMGGSASQEVTVVLIN